MYQQYMSPHMKGFGSLLKVSDTRHIGMQTCRQSDSVSTFRTVTHQEKWNRKGHLMTFIRDSKLATSHDT